MLNYIWGAMILLAVVTASLTGRLADVAIAVIDSAKEAVTVGLTMLGVISMWSGLMKIAEKAGALDKFALILAPAITFLFPGLKRGHPAAKYISANMAANILGLGWAATPSGLKAMEELQKLNKHKDRASPYMTIFLIINMSSLQLITITIIADRALHGSANPQEIIFPGLIATSFSTAIAVIFVKLFVKTKHADRY